MEELKSCPFCGAKAHAVYDTVITGRDANGIHEEYCVCIYCENCPAQMRTKTKYLAVQKWNRRSENEC